MTIREREDIEILLNYLWKDEQLHYQSARRKNHIFVVLKRLAKSIKYKNQ